MNNPTKNVLLALFLLNEGADLTVSNFSLEMVNFTIDYQCVLSSFSNIFETLKMLLLHNIGTVQ